MLPKTHNYKIREAAGYTPDKYLVVDYRGIEQRMPYVFTDYFNDDSLVTKKKFWTQTDFERFTAVAPHPALVYKKNGLILAPTGIGTYETTGCSEYTYNCYFIPKLKSINFGTTETAGRDTVRVYIKTRDSYIEVENGDDLTTLNLRIFQLFSVKVYMASDGTHTPQLHSLTVEFVNGDVYPIVSSFGTISAQIQHERCLSPVSCSYTPKLINYDGQFSSVAVSDLLLSNEMSVSLVPKETDAADIMRLYTGVISGITVGEESTIDVVKSKLRAAGGFPRLRTNDFGVPNDKYISAHIGYAKHVGSPNDPYDPDNYSSPTVYYNIQSNNNKTDDEKNVVCSVTNTNWDNLIGTTVYLKKVSDGAWSVTSTGYPVTPTTVNMVANGIDVTVVNTLNSRPMFSFNIVTKDPTTIVDTDYVAIAYGYDVSPAQFTSGRAEYASDEQYPPSYGGVAPLVHDVMCVISNEQNRYVFHSSEEVGKIVWNVAGCERIHITKNNGPQVTVLTNSYYFITPPAEGEVDTYAIEWVNSYGSTTMQVKIGADFTSPFDETLGGRSPNLYSFSCSQGYSHSRPWDGDSLVPLSLTVLTTVLAADVSGVTAFTHTLNYVSGKTAPTPTSEDVTPPSCSVAFDADEPIRVTANCTNSIGVSTVSLRIGLYRESSSTSSTAVFQDYEPVDPLFYAEGIGVRVDPAQFTSQGSYSTEIDQVWCLNQFNLNLNTVVLYDGYGRIDESVYTIENKVYGSNLCCVATFDEGYVPRNGLTWGGQVDFISRNPADIFMELYEYTTNDDSFLTVLDVDTDSVNFLRQYCDYYDIKFNGSLPYKSMTYEEMLTDLFQNIADIDLSNGNIRFIPIIGITPRISEVSEIITSHDYPEGFVPEIVSSPVEGIKNYIKLLMGGAKERKGKKIELKDEDSIRRYKTFYGYKRGISTDISLPYIRNEEAAISIGNVILEYYSKPIYYCTVSMNTLKYACMELGDRNIGFAYRYNPNFATRKSGAYIVAFEVLGKTIDLDNDTVTLYGRCGEAVPYNEAFEPGGSDSSVLIWDSGTWDEDVWAD